VKNKQLDRIAAACGIPDAAEGCRVILAILKDVETSCRICGGVCELLVCSPCLTMLNKQAGTYYLQVASEPFEEFLAMHPEA